MASPAPSPAPESSPPNAHLIHLRALSGIGLSLGIILMTGCTSMLASLNETSGTSEMGTGDTPAPNTAAVDARQVRKDFDSAMKLIKAEKYGKGIELLSKVTERSKNNSPPYINLAMAYHRAGNLKLAEQNLQTALKIDPDNPVASHEYALLYRKSGRFSEARDLYEKTLAKYPDFNLAHRNLGILCDLYMKDYACALRHYQIYSNAMPDDKAVKIWIADLQKRWPQQNTQEKPWPQPDTDS